MLVLLISIMDPAEGSTMVDRVVSRLFNSVARIIGILSPVVGHHIPCVGLATEGALEMIFNSDGHG